MELTTEQINQMIEGLENRKTKLVATHLITLRITNIISKRVDGDYKNMAFWHNYHDENRIVKKDYFIKTLKIEPVRHSFELVTTNKDKSETRTKI